MNNNKEHNIEFDDGAFKQLFLDFIGYQRSLGYKYGNSSIYTLRSINRDLNRMNLKQKHLCLSKKIIESLAEKRPNETCGTQHYRIGLIRQFSLYLNNVGFNAYLFPKRFLPKYRSDFRPYIFSDSEISAIITAADCLKPMRRYPKYHFIYPALLRLLYGCGLRISEARFLKTQQVDLDQGVIYIDNSKNNTSRYVPMSWSLTDYLKHYVREARIDHNVEGFFFPAPDGGPYDLKAVQGGIKNIYHNARIGVLPNGRLPRVHDIRHTFSVHALRIMKNKGLDVYTSTPLLSAYLGHTNMIDTEKYIHLTALEFGNFITDSRNLLNGILPEVFPNETE
jgi:integrase/recombinase XerD